MSTNKIRLCGRLNESYPMKLTTQLIKTHIAAILTVAAVSAQAAAPQPASQNISDCFKLEVRNLQLYIPWEGIVDGPAYVSHRLSSGCAKAVRVTYKDEKGFTGVVTLNKGSSRDVNGMKGSFKAGFI
jgi:hypothetical protein